MGTEHSGDLAGRPRALRCLPPPGLKALVEKETDVSVFASLPGEGETLSEVSLARLSGAGAAFLASPGGASGPRAVEAEGCTAPAPPGTFYCHRCGDLGRVAEA